MPELPRIHFNPVMSPGSNVHVGRPLAPPPPAADDSAGSVGSLRTIGSVGSILSIGSAGSVLSIGSIGSVASIGSAFSTGAIGGWLEHRSRVVEVAATALTLGALVTATRRQG